MSIFSLDFETTSACDIGFGAYKYASHESTRILLFAIAQDNEAPVIWRIDDPDSPESCKALYLFRMAVKEQAPIRAFNVGFEAAICKYVLTSQLGIPAPALEQWRCTQFLARRSGLPDSLAKAAEFLKLGDQKNPIGKALIGVFSDQTKIVDLLPPKGDMKDKDWKKLKRPSASPILEDEIPWDWSFAIAGGRMTVREGWDAFIAYCRQDVVVERQVCKALAPFEPSPEILAGFHFDLRLNDRGVPVDVPMLEKAKVLIDDYDRILSEKFFNLTGLQPAQTAAVLKWLKGHGYAGNSLNADTVAEVRAKHADKLDEAGKKALNIRAALSFAAVKKVPAMLDWVCPDGRIRGAFTFCGAQKTGRWTSRGPQFQNMKKPSKRLKKVIAAVYRMIGAEWCDLDLIEALYGNPYEVLASLSRYFVRDPDGPIYDVDFAQVEARILPALIGCERILDKFRRGEDIYLDVAKKLGVDRDLAKVVSLLCIAEGELVLTDRGLVPIEAVETSMRVWDGVEWVTHDGVVCMGMKEVISFDGLQATPDHNVYALVPSSGPVKMPFLHAAEDGYPLVPTGRRQNAIRVDETSLMKFKGIKPHHKFNPNVTRVVPVYDIVNAGPRHRFTVSGKLVSNCQFGGGWRAVKIPLKDQITEKEARKAVKVYREENPEVTAAWKAFDAAFLEALNNPGTWVSASPKVKFGYTLKAPFPRMLMRLPAGRDIVYPLPRALPITMWRKGEKDSDDASWQRVAGHLDLEAPHFHTYELEFWGHVKGGHYGWVKTYGGDLLQSCLGLGTQVLTITGFKAIETISELDLVWDGEDFVPCDGVVFKGMKPCISEGGFSATPDHKIMVDTHWVERYKLSEDEITSQSKELTRATLREFNGGRTDARRAAHELESALRLRSGESEVGLRPSESVQGSAASGLLENMPLQRDAATTGPRTQLPSDLRGSRLDDLALLSSEQCQLPSLRREGDQGLPAVAQSGELLHGHAAELRAGAHSGPGGCPRGLHPEELPVGDSEGERPEQGGNDFHGDPVGSDEGHRGRREVGDQLHDTAISQAARGSGLGDVPQAGPPQPVFDIVNCGPRNRFTILTNHGLLCVHNCTQGTGMDFLLHGCVKAEQQGFESFFVVHDQALARATGGLKEYIAALCTRPAWFPNFPLEADGDLADSYQKN